jgi:hypothetical protein
MNLECVAFGLEEKELQVSENQNQISNEARISTFLDHALPIRQIVWRNAVKVRCVEIGRQPINDEHHQRRVLCALRILDIESRGKNAGEGSVCCAAAAIVCSSFGSFSSL